VNPHEERMKRIYQGMSLGRARDLLDAAQRLEPKATPEQVEKLAVRLRNEARLKPTFESIVCWCDGCGVELRLYGLDNCDDNVLVIEFSGGYGQFVDPTWEADEYTAYLCHECAHSFCESTPWANLIINPSMSHSHGEVYRDAHPEHEGWDYRL